MLQSLPGNIGSLSSLQQLYVNGNKLQALPVSLGMLSVEILDVSANELQGLPTTFGSLSSLIVVAFSQNKLQSLPDTLDGLVSLLWLDISHNKLRSLPQSISLIPQLFRFDVNNNELRALPESFGPPSLWILFAFRNKLRGLPEALCLRSDLGYVHVYENELQSLCESIGEFKSLKELRASRNRITVLPSSLANCTSIQELSLYSNEIEVISPSIAKLVKLRNLLIYSNRITRLELPNFQHLTSVQAQNNAISELLIVPYHDGIGGSGTYPLLPALKEILLDHNKLTTVPSSLWTITTSLVTLDLSYNKLSIAIPTAIGTMSKLERLGMTHNKITAVPTELGNLGDKLTMLGLSDNQISGTIPTEFVQLYKLQAVDLSNNRFNGEVPSQIVNKMSRASRFDVSGNNLTGVLPDGLGRAPLISTIVLSSNPWGVDLAAFLKPLLRRFRAVDGSDASTLAYGSDGELGGCSMGPLLQVDVKREWAPCLAITILEIDNTSLTGTIPPALIAINETELLSLRNNEMLEGPLPNATTHVDTFTKEGLSRTVPPPLWSTIDVSGCIGLNGSVPLDWERITTLTLVNISRTSMRGLGAVDDRGSHVLTLPPFVQSTESYRTYDRSATDDEGTDVISLSQRPVVCPILGNDNGLRLEADPDYYNWGFCSCQDGDVGGGGECRDCVLGGDCVDGKSFHNKIGWWCMQHEDDLAHPQCYLCPHGICPDSAVHEQCGVIGRSGVLCGACKEGHSATFGGVRCVPDEDCRSNGGWIFALVVIITGVFVVVLVFSFHPMKVKPNTNPLSTPPLTIRSDSGNSMTKEGATALRVRCWRVVSNSKGVVVLYYQLLPFVSDGLSQLVGSAGGPSRVILAAFNLDIDASAGGGAGGGLEVCAVRGLTPFNKIALGYAVPVILLSWVLVMMVGMRVAVAMKPMLKHKPHGGWVRWYDGPVSALIACSMLAYSNVLKTSMQLLRCVDVGSESVLFLAGAVSCGQSWQSGLYVVVALLAVAPIGLALLSRSRKGQVTSPEYKTLLAPFTLWWWCGALLLQRLVVVSIAVFIAQPITRACWLFVACLAVLLWNAYWRPYRRAVVQLFNQLLLLGLVLVSGLNAVVVGLLTEVSEGDVQGANGLRTVASFAQLLPVVVFIATAVVVLAFPLWPPAMVQCINQLVSRRTASSSSSRSSITHSLHCESIMMPPSIDSDGRQIVDPMATSSLSSSPPLPSSLPSRSTPVRQNQRSVEDSDSSITPREDGLMVPANADPHIRLVEGEWTDPVSEQALLTGDMAMC